MGGPSKSYYAPHNDGFAGPTVANTYSRSWGRCRNRENDWKQLRRLLKAGEPKWCSPLTVKQLCPVCQQERIARFFVKRYGTFVCGSDCGDRLGAQLGKRRQ